MNTKALIWYVSAVICLIIAVIFFIRSVDWKSLVILAFGVAAVLLFRQGIVESKKNVPPSKG
jgi:predicted neutral ceramidase superfamily lipid hydrolase